KFPVYFIPSSAIQCSENEVGCSEFTNIANEKVDYFTRLRLCQKPSDPTSEAFYTWEGSDATGYELRIWNLKRSGVTALHVADGSNISVQTNATSSTLAGMGPCTTLDVAGNCSDTPTVANGLCTKADIDHGNFDCREFYDAAGNRHYRLLSKTILATEECASYRATVSTQTDCELTGGQWNPTKSECIYAAAAGESASCNREANNCRAYKGNASTNVRTSFADTFESGVGDWLGGTQSAESVTAGGHSLKILNTGTATKEVTSMVSGKQSYTLTFWARGLGQLDVAYTWGASNRAAFSTMDSDAATPTVTLSSTWRQYSLGPVIVNTQGWPAAGDQVQLALSGASSDFYLDNVVLKEVQDNIYVVRDSWSTPFECDATSDGQPSPLEMLGCRAYRPSTGPEVYLRSFSQLCREKAVGCAAYSNTQNTANPYAETFNAVCKLIGYVCNEASCACDYEPFYGKILKDVCRVRAGETTCRFNYEGADNLVGGSIAAPDRAVIPTDERIYLAAKSENQCPAEAIGCKNLGSAHFAYQGTCINKDAAGHALANSGQSEITCQDLQTNATCRIKPGDSSCVFSFDDGFVDKWSAATLRDNPAKYDQTLCREETVGCDQYAGSTGSVYFKDPVDKVCQYKENLTVNTVDPATGESRNQTLSGWFQKTETGQNFPCYGELLKQGREFLIYKNSDPQCVLTPNATNVDGNGQCTSSNGCLCNDSAGHPVCKVEKAGTTCGYQGWVGTCPAEADRCEEFVDPLDTSDAYEHGQAYYYLENSRLSSQNCNGNVGLKSGCVLFKKTSDTRNLYSAAATYSKSDKAAASGTVSPENCGEVSSTSSRDERYCGGRCRGIRGGQCISQANPTTSTKGDCNADADCGNYCQIFDVLADCAADNRCQWSNDSCTFKTAYQERCVGSTYYGIGCQSEDDCSKTLKEQCVVETGAPADITANDTNIILKARRDRECGQWLTCAEGYGEWDTSANKWKTVCTQLGTCDQYFKTGEAVECSNFVSLKQDRLTESDYAKRDVTWKGLEYSGYSLIGKYPAQFLTSVNINPGLCRTQNNDAANNVLTVDRNQELFKKNTSQFCYNTGDCGGSNYCAAQVNGRCFDNGKPMDMPCSGDNQCTLNSTVGKCVTGETALRFGIKKGECTENNAPCGEDDHSSKGNGRGLCYQFQCVYDYAGGPLDASNRLNEQSCRAYPESESPFGAQIVDDPAGAGYDTGGNAVKHKAGFQGANICVKGEICECKYQKVSYGRGGAITRYNSYDATAVDRICVGGDKEGQACSANADCNEPNPPNGVNVSGGEGTCERVSKRAFAYGWPGFCLDYDSSFNINGDQNQFACNLWLPVDQLQGAADLFNQHFEAGYISPVNQLMYCQASSGMPAAGLDAEGTHPGYRKRIYYEGTGTFLQGCVSSGYCAPKSESECDNSPNNQDPGFPYGGSLANPAMFGEGNVTGKSCKWNNISHICEDNVEIHPHTGGSNHTFTGATACKDFAMAPPACTGTSSGQCPSLQQPSLVGLDVGLFGEAVLKTSIAVWPCLYPYVGLLCPYIVTSSLCS
ncbi:MAG: hypothetical protein AAB692_04750, partial [Patescibacteria group bacterium]